VEERAAECHGLLEQAELLLQPAQLETAVHGPSPLELEVTVVRERALLATVEV
jgi:hypothetical protein